MNSKRISALPAQVDLQGLPAARLRAVLLALSSPEAAEIFDAQLADLHAEWLAAREHSRLRAAWLALGIRAHLLTCAAYYAVASLGLPALRRTAILAGAAYITLALFFGLASMIARSPLPPDPGVRVPVIHFTMLERPEPPRPSDFPEKPERPEPSQQRERIDVLVDRNGGGTMLPEPLGPREGRGELFRTEPLPPLVPPSPARVDLCLPMVRSEPEYPEIARRRGIEGSVLVQVAIDRAGTVSHAEVLQADPAGVFDDAVLRAVRRWRYRVSGDPSEGCARTQVRLRFERPAGAR